MDSTGDRFVADRIRPIGISGIRKIFDMATQLESPIDLSIGQPDYQPPEAALEAAIRAIRDGKNGYTMTRGIPELRQRIEPEIISTFGKSMPSMITSGVSGGLFLALMSCLDPGDEVLMADPFFVSYPHLVRMAGGVPVAVPLGDGLKLDPQDFEAAMSERTRAILVNSPGNPSGMAYVAEELRPIAELAIKKDVLLISDEIYAGLVYDFEHVSAASLAPEHALLLGGFGKTYGMTGWRMGYASGPSAIIDQMTKLQQYTFVCAPQPLQWGTLAALDTDTSGTRANYRIKRDLVCDHLGEAFELNRPGGGFFVYPKVPEHFGTGTSFVEAALDHNVLTIPGITFSAQDTHFRVSFGTSNEALEEGCKILCALAKG